ncbi:TPA: PD-(D/E)XK nuclease family protein [archaeon]|nr:PD-(D/E)XK nuclease family protein [Candidatus Naiadarchaeales archaeon SRR2090153.bin461]
MFSFDKILEDHIKREHKPKGIGKYYPSEIGNCLRKVWYSYKFPQEIDPDLLKIFEAGNLLHGFVVEVLKSERNKDVQLLKSEFPFKEKVDGFEISGRIDNLVLVKSSGKEVLVEVKSTGDLGFVMSEPKRENVMQLQLYMHVLGIHDGVLLYIDKRNLQSQMFTVPYDKKFSEEVIEKFKKLDKHLREDKLPDPEARIFRNDMGWMCKRCEYRERCYKATPENIFP